MIRRMAVIVPAADEEEHIGNCLSLSAPPALLGRVTATMSLLVRAGIPAGALAAGAIAAAAGVRGALWVLMTCFALSAALLAEAQAGVHLVLGTVLPEPGLRSALYRDWLGRHHLRDGHPHVHGANLGIRGDVYLALGGWPALPAGEDVELARRATAAGHLRIARTAAMPVVTSIRQTGRAPRGFSGYLRDLNPAVACSMTSHPLMTSAGPSWKPTARSASSAASQAQ